MFIRFKEATLRCDILIHITHIIDVIPSGEDQCIVNTHAGVRIVEGNFEKVISSLSFMVIK